MKTQQKSPKSELLPKRPASFSAGAPSANAESQNTPSTSAEAPTRQLESNLSVASEALRGQIQQAKSMAERLSSLQGDEAKNLRGQINALLTRVEQSNGGNSFEQDIREIRNKVGESMKSEGFSLSNMYERFMVWGKDAVGDVKEGATSVQSSLGSLSMATVPTFMAGLRSLLKGINDLFGTEFSIPGLGHLDNPAANRERSESLPATVLALNNVTDLTHQDGEGHLSFTTTENNQTTEWKVDADGGNLMKKKEDGSYEAYTGDANRAPVVKYLQERHAQVDQLAAKVGINDTATSDITNLTMKLMQAQQKENKTSSPVDVVRYLLGSWKVIDDVKTDKPELAADIKKMLTEKPEELVQTFKESEQGVTAVMSALIKMAEGA